MIFYNDLQCEMTTPQEKAQALLRGTKIKHLTECLNLYLFLSKNMEKNLNLLVVNIWDDMESPMRPYPL